MPFMRYLYWPAALAAVCAIAAPALADDIDELGRAADEKPDDARAADAFASAALKQKRYDDAIRRLKVAVARIPDYSEGYYKLAYAYRQKKEWADAADYYRRYLAVNPSRTDTYFGLGAALEGLGDKKGAISAYEKYVALEKSPGKQRFIDEAKAELVKLDPARAPAPVAAEPAVATAAVAGSDAASLRSQADALRAQSRWADAAAAYQRAIAVDKNNLDLYNDLGNCYFALKQYGDAAKAFSEATQRDPSYALGWYNLAHALRRADRPREAADAYKQYIKLKPDDPDPYYGLGQTLKALGDANGAIAAFQKYVSMERRPDEQKWVEKARAELQALEAAQAPKSAAPSGKIEEKVASEDAAARERLDRELRRDAVLPPSDDDLRLMDPFARYEVRDPFKNDRDIRDPFRDGDEIIDPFARSASPAVPEKLRAYGAALAAYRRALARHAEEVTVHFERGMVAGNGANALRAWNNVPLDDSELEAARASVERIRKQLASTK
jgi:tetratricopeptide (TPR) repeat protein